MKVVVRHARQAETGQTVDIALDGRRIAAVGRVTQSGDKEIDATGLTVFPGLIDPHVHFREPGDSRKEGWTSGSRAAAAGGFTTVLDMPNTNPPLTDAVRLEEKRRFAQQSCVDYGFHFALTRENVDLLANIPEARSVKIFLGQSTGNLLVDDRLLERAFQVLPRPLFVIHAESEACLQRLSGQLGTGRTVADHGKLRDRACALEAVTRVLLLAGDFNHPVYLCHVSTVQEVAAIRTAKAQGIPVFAEVTPHHLFLDESDARGLGMFAKVNPPLRTREDREALLAALRDGTIDVVGTDHAPHLRDEKQRPYPEAPAGLPGLETALPLMLTAVAKGELELQTVVRVMTAAPAEIFSLSSKGRLEPGLDADLTLVDLTTPQPVIEDRVQTKCGWSPFAGRTLTGWPVITIVGGEVVFDRGTFYPHQGREVYHA